MPLIDRTERIAIVGVGGIFPGALDLTTFWNNIANGVDSGRHVPTGRWFLSPSKAFDTEGPRLDRVYSTWGCFIEDFHFDPTGLSLDDDLLGRLDPLFHLGLHAARAAIADANHLSNTNRDRVGVILGNIALPTESTSAICRNVLGRTLLEKLIDATPHSDHHRQELKRQMCSGFCDADWHPLNRFAASLPAALIARGLNLGGLAYTLDAACASSLYALKFACEELRAYRAEAMLAGGMSRPDCQYTQMGFAQLKALSRRGRCAPLSSAADGLVVGEGAGVFVLKRLRDAVAAGDHIYGVIAGIGLSNDRGANLLAPHSEGQLRAMQSAYAEAGWRPSDVDLIECHATGTPVGDGVEISSLHQLWQAESSHPGQCVIGGVKSNVGHLLTGAGAAGLLKVLFAIQHKILPPTANYEQPATGLDQAHSPFRVLAKAEPWHRRADQFHRDEAPSGKPSTIPSPRRATVNAFGFGGINAHVLIEEYLGTAGLESAERVAPRFDRLSLQSLEHGSLVAGTLSENSTRSGPDLAIVGLAVQLGDSRSAGDSNRKPTSVPETASGMSTASRNWGVEETRWYGQEFGPGSGQKGSKKNAIACVHLPLGEFRIPPLEMQDMLPQQQLMLRVAADALRDVVRLRAGDSVSEIAIGNRTGVFVGIELDPNTTNFHLRWSVEEHAPRWAETLGLKLTPMELDEWIIQLKDAIGPGLTANRVMGNLGGIVASRLAREFNVGGPSFTISADANSGLRACELACNALRRNELDLALVGAVDLPCDIRSQVAALRELKVGTTPPAGDGATAVVLKRIDDAIRDDDPIYAVIRESDIQVPDSSIPLASLPVSVGAATGLMSLARSVTSLIDTKLDAPSCHYWLQNRTEGVRRIRVNGCGIDGKNLAFEVCEPPATARRPASCGSSAQINWGSITANQTANSLPAHLFVIDGNSTDEMSTALQQLADQTKVASSLGQLASDWYHSNPPYPEHRLALALVVQSLPEMSDVFRLAMARLRESPAANNRDRRIQFTRQPLGRVGRMAYVFPGSGNAFSGMGRELLATFPEVLRQQETENQRLQDQYRPDLIWHGDSTAALLDDHKAMIFGQVALGTAVCDLLKRFAIVPSASLGYSLGESAALFGLRAWTDRDEMLRRMDDATLFGSDLVYPFNAARSAWNVPEGCEVDWISGVIDRPDVEIRRAIAGPGPLATGETDWNMEPLPSRRDDNGDNTAPSASQHVKAQSRFPRVYLLIVNTPSQCVIGGQRDEVLNLVRELNASFSAFAAPSTVHCEILRQVETAYRELHLRPTTARPDAKPIDFYSTAWGRRYDLTRESAAEAIVAQAVRTIDFPRVIESAYADGVRLFVEIGPGSSCTRMIDEILGDREHRALAAVPATSNPVAAFFELLAILVSERISVDLSFLYGQLPTDEVNRNSNVSVRAVVTPTSGLPFVVPTPPRGWQVTTNRINGVASAPNGSSNQLAPDTKPRESSIPRKMHSRESALLTETKTIQATASSATLVTATVDPAPRPDAHSLRPNRQTQIDTHGTNVMTQLDDLLSARLKAHETYLRVAAEAQRVMAEQLTLLAQLTTLNDDATTELPIPQEIPDEPPRSLSRPQCMEFAIGKIGRVLGKVFAKIDENPTRVRLPDEPLMLVDRILEIEGEPLSMTSGRVVTEHDIHSGAWYLDCNRIPTCIAVEAGQADLFLSGWLGIDRETKGLACYRLLDAVVTFHRELPQPGKVIHYDIRINHFFRQGKTYLFRFEFDATVDGEPLLTMREGCAGFFTEAELAGGKGIVHTALDRTPRPGKRPQDWIDPVPMKLESYDDSQLMALRRGQLDACFSPAFSGLPLTNPVTLPGISSSEERTRMWLIDRVLKLDPAGGKFGLGTILGELDIHPDDWFLTCHFCDDQVMPGTLMYECCLHTLRIYLLRMGWIGEAGQIAYEPIPGIRSRLKCRGQVRANNQKVWYEITLKEIGYGHGGNHENGGAHGGNDQDPGAPYCLADALMYADGKPIVEITDMSVRLSGLTRKAIEKLWCRRSAGEQELSSIQALGGSTPGSSTLIHSSRTIQYDRRPALFDTDRITAFAIGKPSEAFGDRYRVFDAERIIARLPGPPFQFLDRIVSISGCQPWVLQANGEVVAQYDIPVDAWYFASNRQWRMPFAVLLETALQPCGWLAAYVGSALTSDTDLSFRNLGGSATQLIDVTPESGTLTTTVKMTRVSNSGGMIIQHYDFDLRCNDVPVYVGNTYFGFFSRASLANQIGIRDAKPFSPSPADSARAKRFPYINARPFADERFQMISDVELSLEQGPNGHGYVVGTTSVDPSSWFFKAHFHQDPVVPGSLGLESFFQLLKLYAAHRWPLNERSEFSTPLIEGQSASISPKHEWVYRGQVVPRDKRVTVSAVVTHVDDANQSLSAEGFLSVDGRVIYQMKNFSLGVNQ